MSFLSQKNHRFQFLQNIFISLKEDKENSNIGDAEQYLMFFDEEALQYFNWPPLEENSPWREKWLFAQAQIRTTNQFFNCDWEFDAMISAFREGGFFLVSCEMINAEKARLIFCSYAYPYGGTECMQALVESFGFKILAIEIE